MYLAVATVAYGTCVSLEVYASTTINSTTFLVDFAIFAMAYGTCVVYVRIQALTRSSTAITSTSSLVYLAVAAICNLSFVDKTG
jgi:hypothetical protein